MSERTKWKTVDWPMAHAKNHQSLSECQDHVDQRRESYMSGKGRVTQVVVKFKAGTAPWATYENVRFSGREKNDPIQPRQETR
jgi:hypothetical protein